MFSDAAKSIVCSNSLTYKVVNYRAAELYPLATDVSLIIQRVSNRNIQDWAFTLFYYFCEHLSCRIVFVDIQLALTTFTWFLLFKDLVR